MSCGGRGMVSIVRWFAFAMVVVVAVVIVAGIDAAEPGPEEAAILARIVIRLASHVSLHVSAGGHHPLRS
jgi:hypothetical protein